TFLFQRERLSKFTIPGCPNSTSPVYPVSYVIGVWEPQRLIWQAIMIHQFPARVLIGYISYQYFGPQLLKIISGVLYVIEIIALPAVSIVHIDANFLIHATLFALWLISFNFNFLFLSTMLRNQAIQRRILFRCAFTSKMILFFISFNISVSTGFFYPYATIVQLATLQLSYAVFCLSIFWLA
ncbi:hypothetical protein PENTCL1PPCAC_3056, partial [Pristionchus entomophagus]